MNNLNAKQVNDIPFYSKKNYWTFFFTFGAIMLNCNLHQLMHFHKKFFFFLFLIFKFIFADVLIQILTDIPRIYILPDFKGVERFTNWKQDFESEKGKKKTRCFPESSISCLGGKNASTKKPFNDFVWAETSSLFSDVHRNGSKHFFA